MGLTSGTGRSHEHACRQAVYTLFAFLDLLEADTDFFRQDLLTYA